MASHEKLMEAARVLARVGRPIKILSTVEWHPRVKERFFARGARELPRPRYHPPDLRLVHEATRHAKSLVPGRSLAARWMRRQATQIDRQASMMEAVGTAEFSRLAGELYGVPSAPLIDGKSTSLQLARRIDRVLQRLSPDRLGSEPEPMTATQIAVAIQHQVESLLGDAAPRVVVTKHLSAKAAARSGRIRLRADAHFTKEDINQLVMHEAMVHIATSLNGRRQRKLPVLSVRHAGTTRTQEGLAVFSELISGALGPARLRRLANRVLAVQHSLDGADFLDLYRFFLERSADDQSAFEDARRIVRGGLVTGGAPFPKDGVYLDGLVRVHNFLRAVVELRRPDLLTLLFCGKLEVEDVPILAFLRKEKLIRPPKYLPPWAQDRRFVVSYLTYSGFLNRIQLKTVRQHYADLLAHCAAAW